MLMTRSKIENYPKLLHVRLAVLGHHRSYEKQVGAITPEKTARGPGCHCASQCQAAH
jgi:hypothetical protein